MNEKKSFKSKQTFLKPSLLLQVEKGRQLEELFFTVFSNFPFFPSVRREWAISTQLCCDWRTLRCTNSGLPFESFFVCIFADSFSPNKVLTPPEIIPDISKWVSNSPPIPLSVMSTIFHNGALRQMHVWMIVLTLFDIILENIWREYLEIREANNVLLLWWKCKGLRKVKVKHCH